MLKGEKKYQSLLIQVQHQDVPINSYYYQRSTNFLLPPCEQSIEDAPALEELLPPRGGPDFKYATTDKNLELTDGHRLSRELTGLIRSRKTSREISSWVEEYIIKEHGPKFALEVVAQTLLDIGSKSFTHLITVLERYGQVMILLCYLVLMGGVGLYLLH
jgi:MIF4G like